jgi:hypothetical protein
LGCRKAHIEYAFAHRLSTFGGAAPSKEFQTAHARFIPAPPVANIVALY